MKHMGFASSYRATGRGAGRAEDVMALAEYSQAGKQAQGSWQQQALPILDSQTLLQASKLGPAGDKPGCVPSCSGSSWCYFRDPGRVLRLLKTFSHGGGYRIRGGPTGLQSLHLQSQ